MTKEQLFVLNPDYNFKNDIKRSIIIANSFNQCEMSVSEWDSIIHPVQAMILSYFSNPITIEKAVDNLSVFLEISKEETQNIIKPFIENEEDIFTEYDGHVFRFPKKIIIKYHNNLKIEYTYTPEDFAYSELDFETYRLFHSPSSISIMVTNKCVTNCVYCYADKKQEISCQIPFERIQEILAEAKRLKIASVNIGGGEIFLYKKWYELFCELKKYGYDKFLISTKIPINENDIIKLKQFPFLTYQFSLDSLSEKKIKRILDVSGNYIKNMKHTLELMDKHGLTYHVQSVLTNLNSDKECLTEMFNYLSTLKNINHWEARIAFRSLYSSTEFESIKLQEQERLEAFGHLDGLIKKDTLKVNVDKSYLERGFFSSDCGSKGFPGASCSANRSHIYILPEGNVTICEQMYWKKRFIIGNILENSIEEVWNSPASIKWVNMTKDDFRNESACKTCDKIDDCFNKYTNRCWADILKVYGDENWDFPDPRCNKAPAFIYPII